MAQKRKNDGGLKRYRLDVSAKFYPIISTKKAQSIFRICAEMDEPVDPVALQRAAEVALNRFPTFRVRLKKGYAWHYLEENPEPFDVLPSSGVILAPFDKKQTRGHLFRLCYVGNMIEMEVFHAVSDGLGALELMKAVVLAYALEKGRTLGDISCVADLGAASAEEEAEDAFYRYYRPIKFGDINLKGLMGEPPQLLGGTLSEDGYKSDFSSLPADELKVAARNMNATLTSFMCGAMAYAVERVTKGKRPIVMMVPVNLRKMFPSATLRNFVNFVRLVFRPGELHTLGEYVSAATEQLKAKTTKEEMEKFFATTVRAEKSLLLKLAPLWFKTVMARIFRVFLKSRQTVIFSNMGYVAVPEGCGVRRLVFNLNVSKNATVNVGALTVGNATTVAFTRAVKERNLEHEFYAALAQAGVTPSDGCVAAL